MKRLTFRYPSFANAYNALGLFGIIALVAFAIYGEKILFFEFWVGLGALAGIVIAPILVITFLSQRSITFDFTKGEATVRQILYRDKIPFEKLQVRIETEKLLHGFFVMSNWIWGLLALILTAFGVGNTLYRLYVSDGSRDFRIAESLLEKRIVRFKEQIEQGIQGANEK